MDRKLVWTEKERRVSPEQPLNQFLATDFKMRGHATKNPSQCSHSERVVIGNRDMMLAAFPGRQPQVTAGLPRDFVA